MRVTFFFLGLALLPIPLGAFSHPPVGPDEKQWRAENEALSLAASLGILTDEESFAQKMRKLAGEKPAFVQRQKELLAARYDLSNHTSQRVTMSRGKPIQVGVRTRLPEKTTWEDLARLSPEEIKQRDLWPKGFLPLPHSRHEESGMVFPNSHIEELKRQTGRDLTRFDTEFDLPDHFLSEFPAAIYLTTRPDLGDVSEGKLITSENFYEHFDGKINPKQLDGFRLLVTPMPQQQFNLTTDRRSARPNLGVTCFDCHANGHTNNGFHTVQDIRPDNVRPRVDTPSLRGVNIQRLFGSQRALKTVEDFTEFEQGQAYFDGDFAKAQRKGFVKLDRVIHVQPMGEMQEILDFPPNDKLDVLGKLIPAKATEAELRGERLFYGKAQCATCHQPPYFTDNSMHNLKEERFFTERIVNGHKMRARGPVKTFPLRGIKDSPPYLHDGRLLTLDDTVEFFNLVLGTKLTAQEKSDVVAFLQAL